MRDMKWMTNGEHTIGVRIDEIAQFENDGYQKGRKFKPAQTEIIKLFSPDITWAYHSGTELVDPVYYAYYKRKIVPKIHIQDCSSYHQGYSVCRDRVINQKRIFDYTIHETLDDAREVAEFLIYRHFNR